MKGQPTRFPVLQVDILRGVAAFMVFLGHAMESALDATVIPPGQPAQGLARLLLSTVGSGAFWVWGFFVISGLCIHRSIMGDIHRARFTLRHYVAARLSRIYPLYLVGLAGALLAGLLIAWRKGRGWDVPVEMLVGNLFMTQAYTQAVPFFGPSWSLTCEVLYYAAWPLALWLCRWQAWRALIISAIFLGVAGWQLFSLPGNEDSVTASVFVFGLLWLGGAALAQAWDRAAAWVSVRHWCAGWVLVVLSYALVGWVNYHDWGPTAKTWISLSSLPGWLIIIAGARHFQVPEGSRLAMRAEWLGNFSYPCYILHRPLLALAAHALPTSIFLGSWPGALARLAGSMLPGLLLISTAGLALECWVMSRRQRWLRTLRASD